MQYPEFRAYLISLLHGPEFLIPLGFFPRRIFPNTTWHKLLENIRAGTDKDLHERYALIGFRENKAGILLPTNPTIGSKKDIPLEVQARLLECAKRQSEVTGYIGYIHSHSSVEDPAFSAQDLFNMVRKARFRPILGLVHGGFNIFALKSKESIAEDVEFFNRDDFATYWYEKYGFTYNPRAKTIIRQENGGPRYTGLSF